MTDSFQKWAEQEFDDTALPNQTITCKTLHPMLADMLDELPDPVATNVWADELDALQLQLRECLSRELINRLGVLAFPDMSEKEVDRLEELISHAITLAFITEIGLDKYFYGENDGL